VEGAHEHDCFAGREDRHLIEQASRLHRDDASEMINIIGILEPVADEVRTLADDSLANLARPLTRDDQR
jgi:hypothetical protein